MKRIKKHTFLKVLITLFAAALMVVTLLPNNTVAQGTKVSDASTIGKFHDSLGDDASTEYAGRIWSDKTVFSENTIEIDLRDGGKATVENDSDFLVGFSALATSSSISGQTQSPIDVVFIIDTSGSMTDSMSNTDSTSRITNLVNALNNSIQSLMDLNPYTRVSVVAYATNSEVLLPLGRYSKGTRTTGNGYNQTTITNYFSLANSWQGSTLYIHAVGQGDTRSVNDSRSVSGGTNIQKGIYDGMNVLATSSSTTVSIGGQETKRVPSIVILSDGAPTYSVNSQNWWNPTGTNTQGDGNTPYYGNGMKVLMSAAYMKEAINRHYGVSGTAYEATMYTIGMGINGLSQQDGSRNLARVTLNPAAYWNTNNTMSNNIRSAWNSYVSGGRPNIQVNNNTYYQLNHPTNNDINSDPNALVNLVDSYYDADDAASVTNVFAQIVSNISISAPEVPTELKHTDVINTGFITYIDPIGQYMEVKDVKGITYNGHLYTNPTKNSDGTYTFTQNVETSLYGTQSLSSIRISVSKDAATGMETMKIEVPAALIPVRINTVTLNKDETVKSHTNNGSFPIRVLYTVGLQEELLTHGNTAVDSTKISAEYLAANTDETTGKLNFYSNLFTGQKVDGHEHTRGDAIVEFEPSHTNPFYYMQEDDPIYVKNGNSYTQFSGTNANDLNDNTTYYFINDYYHGTSVETEYLARTGAQLKKVNIISKGGYLYREAGSPRLNRILEFAGNKVVNATNTADDFYYPTFVHAENNPDPAAGKYVIYLGNNGKLSMASTATLDISKTVVTNGYNPSTTQFEFTVDFNGNETLSGSYPYTIYDASGNETNKTGTISDGGKLVLEDGERARIGLLPDGTTYKVSEKDYSDVGFTTAKTADTGTIEAGEVNEAIFTNTYNVTSVVYPGQQGLLGKKVFTGRGWKAGESYTFLMTPYNNAPAPANTEITVNFDDAVEVNGNYEAQFGFDNITFEEPGVYRYTIVEKEPDAEDALPGVSYSGALYRIVITVEDNGNGKLSITNTDIQKLYTDDATPLFTFGANNQIIMNAGQEGQDEISFTNSYSAESIVRAPIATKVYTDTSNATQLESGMFEFKLEAVSENAPMPEGSVNGAIIVANEDGNVTFPSIEFKMSDLGNQDSKTFVYKMSEVNPNVAGMDWDETVYYAFVTVSKGDSVLSVTRKYTLTNDINAQEVDTPQFTNVLDPVDEEVVLTGTKTLTGRNLTANDSFTFELSPTNAAARSVLTAPVKTTITGTNDFSFDKLTFDKVGTYTFSIKEEIPTGELYGITYDTHVTSVRVVVSLNKTTGELESTVVYDNKGVITPADPNRAHFVNTYLADKFTGTKVNLTGTKTLSGKALLPGEFYFNVKDMQSGLSTLVTHEVDSDHDGKAEITFLKDVTYTRAGTYKYEIYEQIPLNPVKGNNYDTTKYLYTVVVKDNGDGTISVDSTSLSRWDEDAWVNADEIVIKNTYAPDPLSVRVPPVTKVISGDRAKALEDNEFLFELTLDSANPDDGIKLPATTVVGNKADGTVQFDNLTITKAGTYKFTIKEVIPADADKVDGITYSTQEISATLVVTDDRNGNLSVIVAENVGGKTIVNEYNAEGTLTLDINKNFTGRANNEWLSTDKFDFEVEILDPATQEAVEAGYLVFPTDGANHIVELTIDANTSEKKVTSPEIIFKKAGTYRFVVREVTGTIAGVHYDETIKEVVVTVSDKAVSDGTFDVVTTINGVSTTSITFNNNYDTDSTELSGHDNLVVTKVFTGRENNAWLDSDKFEFTLEANNVVTKEALTNGNVVFESTTLTVTKANRAHAYFGNITFKTTGEYEFLVKEVNNGIKGVTYDADSDRVVKVVVTDNNAGGLIAQVKDDSEVLEFTNKYSTTEATLEGEANLKVTKQYAGKNWTDETFTFKLEADEVSAEAVANGTVVMPSKTTITIKKEDFANNVYAKAFDNIKFKKAGNYIFMITEVKGANENITYDAHKTEVVVEIVDNNEGALVVNNVEYTDSLTFKNTYTPDAIDASFSGVKTLTGKRNLADDEFEFTIKAVDTMSGTSVVTKAEDTPMPQEIKVKNKGKDIKFGKATYTKAGIYTYEIVETSGNILGVTYDNSVIRAVVNVTYNADTGKLSSTVTYSGGKVADKFEFVNVYTPRPSDEVNFTIGKEVTSTSGNSFTMNGGDFEFEITPALSNPDSDPVTRTVVSNDANGVVTFISNAKYTKEGTYVYTIHEEDSKRSGITLDPSVYKITVVVTDNVTEAKLETDITVEKNGTILPNGIADITFNNGYKPQETTAIIHGHKVLEGGHKDLEANEFTFNLTALNNAPLPNDGVTSVKNDVTGLFQFDAISFTSVGVYEYEVSETDANVKGYTYDDTIYTVTITVTDDNGALKAEVEGIKDANDDPIIVFENIYAPDKVIVDKIVGNKNLLDKDSKVSLRPINPAEFKFKLLDENNTVVADADVKADGTFEFVNIEFSKAGTYNYTVVEEDTNVNGIVYDTKEFEVVIKVEDKGGYLTADVSYPEVVEFSNKYIPNKAVIPFIEIAKVLEGRKLVAEEFTFVLEDEDGTKYYATNDADGVVMFENEDGTPLLTYEKPGTYEYTIYEVEGDDDNITYDTTVYDLTVTVSDDFSGQLTYELSNNGNIEVFTNVHTADSIKVTIANVKKILNNKSDKELGLDGFIFKLETDGMQPVTVTTDETGVVEFVAEYYDDDAGNTFTYVLSEVDTDEDHMTYDTTVYTVKVSITKDDQGILHAALTLNDKACEEVNVNFTNTYNPPVDTGDNTNTTVLISLSLGSFLAILAVLIRRRKRV